jgi:hypothetical protein
VTDTQKSTQCPLSPPSDSDFCVRSCTLFSSPLRLGANHMTKLMTFPLFSPGLSGWLRHRYQSQIKSIRNQQQLLSG